MAGILEFKARVADLRTASKHITFNRAQNADADLVDLLVSECVATFRAVGTSTEIPVHGLRPGTARIPFLTFEKIAGVARTFKGNETTISVRDGAIKIGSWQTKSPEITTGTIPDQNIDMPADAGVLDTLAMASLLTPQKVKEQGIEHRVRNAERAKENAIDAATKALQPLDVAREQIVSLVEEHIRKTGEGLRSLLRK